MNKIALGMDEEVLELLQSYGLTKEKSMELTKKLIMRDYEIRQRLKERIIAEFEAVYEPDFGCPGHEILPANNIGIIDERFDYTNILKTPIEKIDFFH